jgi:hypothetical protein
VLALCASCQRAAAVAQITTADASEPTVASSQPEAAPSVASVASVVSASPSENALKLPDGFDQLHRADTIEIRDRWSGFGPGHDWVVLIERRASGFTWRLKQNVPNNTGAVATSAVDGFLRTLERHTIDPSPPPLRNGPTDDYPKVDMTVTVAGISPIHFSLTTGQRLWHVNGRVLSPDPVIERDWTFMAHHAINLSYRALLDACGQASWPQTTAGY